MDADTLNKIANLPWNLQIVLGSGYLAYLISYFGLRQQHKPVDAIFLTISFGAVAAVVVSLTSALVFPARLGLAFLAAMLTAILWRAWGRKALRGLFRSSGYSWADDTTSAWDHLLEHNDAHPTQLTVETNDGWQFFCTNTAAVGDLPFGPYVIGNSGDVLMYADHSQGPGEESAHPADGMTDPEWGSNVTYLPAAQIKRVMIRYVPVTSSKGRAAQKAAQGVKRAAAKLPRLARVRG